MKRFAILLLAIIPLFIYAQTPTDSVGLFAVYDTGLVRVEKITHSKVKGSGGLGSALTMGVAKIKAKLEFSGITSNTKFNGMAKFRFYFGNPPIEQIQNLYMFNATYSIKNFDVAKFEVKKGNRLLTGVSSSIMGSTVGVSSADVQINTTEIKKGIYEVCITGEPGEYCIMFTANGTGGFGGVFDFTIK